MKNKKPKSPKRKIAKLDLITGPDGNQQIKVTWEDGRIEYIPVEPRK